MGTVTKAILFIVGGYILLVWYESYKAAQTAGASSVTTIGAGAPSTVVSNGPYVPVSQSSNNAMPAAPSPLAPTSGITSVLQKIYQSKGLPWGIATPILGPRLTFSGGNS